MMRSVGYCFLLAAVCGIVFSPVLTAEFLNFDDPLVIGDNPPVQNGLTWDGLHWALTTHHFANWMPLTWASHMLDVQRFGLDASGHHQTNLVLHIVAAICLFVALRTATGMPSACLLAALLYAVHPLQVEPVAWIAERKGVMSSAFGMASFACYVSYAVRRQTGRSKALFYVLSLLLFAASLASKQMLVTLPVLLLVFDRWMVRSTETAVRWRDKVPFGVIAAVFAGVALHAQEAGAAVSGIDDLSIGRRLADALVAMVGYLRLWLWPSGIAPFYPRPIDGFGVAHIGWSLVVLTAVSTVAWKNRKDRPWLCFGWFWFLTAMLPVIGLVPIGRHFMADRYAAIPFIGLHVAAAFQIASWYESADRLRRPLMLLVGGWLIALGFHSFIVAQAWRTSETLFERAVVVTPQSFMAHHQLGHVRLMQGRTDEAARHFAQAAELDPSFASAWLNLGIAEEKLAQSMKAFWHFETAVALDPDSALARHRLGLALANQKRFPEAFEQLERAVALTPDDGLVVLNLGGVLRRAGQLQRAEEMLNRAFSMLPNNPRALVELAVLRLEDHRPKDALQLIAANQPASDGTPILRELKADALAQVSQVAEALAIYGTLEARPGLDAKMAWLYATAKDDQLRNGREAALRAQRALDSNEKEPLYWDVRAAAYAEVGDFANAISCEETALLYAFKIWPAEERAKLQERLELYRTKRPFRQ